MRRFLHKTPRAAWAKVLALVLSVLFTAAGLSACAPLLVGGAVIGGLSVTDRRTTGTQIEDEGIELRAAARVREALAERAHINITSYNRLVLLTGEVPSAAVRQQVEQIVRGVDNVRSTVNELAVLGNSSLTQRTSDSVVTGKVKATFIDARDLQANAFKVVTERGNVYLMGRVTQREADRATELTRTVGGVQRVVRVFEIVSEDELKRLTPPPPPPRAPGATPG